MVDTRNNPSHCEQGTLQSYLDNELPTQREEAVDLHLKECGECREVLDELRAMDQIIRQEIGFLRQCTVPALDPKAIIQHVDLLESSEQAKTSVDASETKGWFQQFMDFLLGSTTHRWALAGLAVGAIVLLTLPKQQTQSTLDSDIVVKGWRAEMLYSRLTQKTKDNYSETKTIDNKTSLSPKDLIQFQYQVPKATHMMIVGLNEQGEVFPLVVSDNKQSQLVEAGKGRFPRKQAFQLDHYIGLERYFFIISTQPFSFQAIQSAIQQTWKNNQNDVERLNKINKSWQVRTWLVRKTKRLAP